MPSVTAGFKCAPLIAVVQYTATVTARAQPVMMTIQSLACPCGTFQHDIGDDAITEEDENHRAE
jgi:hypothetical protein